VSSPRASDGEPRSIEIDGRRFAWRALGSGKPLLLVNGYAATSADWDPALLGALSDSRELICPDNPREQASRLISRLFPPDVAPQIDRRFGEVVAAARAQLSPAALAAQERALIAWHDEAQPLPGVGSPPVLAICGSEDVVVPPQNADALAARWPGTRVERIAGGGHAFMAQQPERVAALMLGFLG
jgi:pimeloyl-ACP methyl ester carboxylesterase